MNKEANMYEEEIILAPHTELLDEATEISQSTMSDEKFFFALQYDTNQKEFLLSMLGTVGAIVENDDEEGHILATMMNMTQLAFIKHLDCVERVKTDEGINPFLAEEADKLTPMQQVQQNGDLLDDEMQAIITDIDHEPLEVEVQTNFDLALNNMTNANLEAIVTAEEDQVNDSVAIASVAASAGSSCSNCSCPTNINMENAATISDESHTSGYICCPGAEQWFKFVATRTGRYTIYTTGKLDTIGTLYDCCGNLITEVNNYAPCGKINFRIIRDLVAGNTYYVKVGICKGDVGSYTLRVTESVLANYVSINKDTITLEKGVLYELPITPNYTYKGYNGAQPIPGLSVSVKPSNASEQKIWWWEQYGSILECSYGWDDDGDRYIHVTATGTGTAKLYAEDWNENGKRDECTATVGTNVKENVEYHLLCNGDINNALRVGFTNVLEFEHISPVRGERLSYWNRQKWMVKSEGGSKKIYTKLDKTYCLSNISGKAYVSNNATNDNAEITITPHGNSGNDYTISLTNQNLYLTLVHGNYQDVTGLHTECNGITAYWGEWKEYNALDPSNQIWQFVEQPASHHYGVDTYEPIDSDVASVLKNDGYDFVIRYYTSLSHLVTGKLLDNTEVLGLRNANLKIVSVYQDYGNNISDFSIEKANLHAERAMELAEGLNQPEGSVIYFGVDFSPSSSELNTIVQYFITVKNKLSGKYKIGVYGTAEVCDLIRHDLASHSWLSHNIRNNTNTNSIEGTPEYISYDSQLKYDIKQAEKRFYNGIEFDYDTAINDDYGQW